MRHCFSFLSALALLVSASAMCPAWAAWPPEGVLLCQDCDARGAGVASDGVGGVFVVWTDSRNGPSGSNDDIFLQHLMASGDLAPGWPVDGLPVCTAELPQALNAIVPDGLGGVLIVWADYRNVLSGTTDIDIYAQRVLADGSLAPGWPVNGAPVSRTPGRQTMPTVAVDGTGGGFFTWHDSSDDIYLQHLSAQGGVATGWLTEGLPISVLPALQGGAQVIADGSGGALLAWGDFRDGPIAVYAQRVTPSGALAGGWPGNGIRLILNRYIREIILDGAGGAYLSCATGGSFLDAGYYLQRFTADGAIAVGWPADGVPVCLAPDERYGLRMEPDQSGGALLCWTDYRAFPQENFLARIQPDGTRYPGWPINGLRIAENSVFDVGCDLAPDGAGGAFLSWSRQLADGDHVFVQHMRGDATIAGGWPTSGHLIPTQYPAGGARITSDGFGGAIAAWEDQSAHVRALRLAPNGPVAVQVSLVSSEAEPGRVRLTWFADDAPSLLATVERRTLPTDWEQRSEITADGAGRFSYEDRDVVAGSRYAYRLAYTEGASRAYTAEAWVNVPASAQFALRGVAPNPSAGDGLIAFSLASSDPAMLELFDLRGRRVVAREVGSLGAGSHMLKLSEQTRLAAGVYTVRLRQGERTAIARAVVIR